MCKTISCLAILFAAVVSASDGARPWIKGATDRDPLSYRSGEEMTFTLTLKCAEDLPPGLDIFWTRTGDDGKRDSGKVPADPAKPLVLKTSIDRPGFVRIFAILRDPDGNVWMPDGGKAKKDRSGGYPRSVFFDGGAGADVDAIEPGVPEPQDFEAFWAHHRATLAAVPMDGAKCEELPSANPSVKVFSISVPCVGPKPATGYLVVPTREGKYPAEIHFHGYGASWSKRATDPPDVSRERGGVLKLILSAHGFELNRDAAYYREERKKVSSNGHGHAFDPLQNADPEKAYFCGMTYRVMRGIEYLKSRPEWDGRDLTTVGASQGGLQAIWGAALVQGVTAAHISIPWCCDIGGTEVGRNRGEWFVKWVFALGYYDPVNIARLIPQSCRVDVKAGLGDYTCPPSGVAAFYNRLKCPKSIVWTQGATHGYTPPERERHFRESVCASGRCALATSAHPVGTGWANINLARTMPRPEQEIWCAPLDKGMEAFRVEWRDGARGTVDVVDGALRIEKKNAEGMVVVTAADEFDAKPGAVVQGFAACYGETPVDPGAAKAYIRLWSGMENLRWDRKHFNGATADSPTFLQLMNNPGGHFTRKLCRTRADASGKVTAAIIVEGAPSVTFWREWGAEDAAAADKAWSQKNRDRSPPDRSATLIDEAAFDAALAADTDHSARMAKTPCGGVLEIDGKPAPPILYKPIPFGMGVPFTGEGRMFEEAGVDLQAVNIRLGVGYGRVGFWSTNGFDRAGAVRRVKDFMRSAPHSLFFMTIRCDAYPEYADEHPDEKWLRPDGTVVYGSCSRGERVATPEPPPHTWPWVSNHSQVWRTDVKRLMTGFVAELKRTGLAKRIVGVHLAGYHDGQFAVPVPDFSKPAAAAFREWQRREYGAVKWQDAPKYHSRELLDPVADEALVAYQKFLKWAPMAMQEDYAHHLKKEFGKPIVVGRWCMNSFGASIMGSLDFTPFTRSDALDFLVAQPHYCYRLPGLSCGIRRPLESFRIHGKAYLNEFDLRTWHGRSGENEGRGVFLSEATDLPMWESLHRKLAGQMFAQRMGWWYFDMSDNWFDDKGILADIASVRRAAAAQLSAKPSKWRAPAAVVVDEEGLLHRNRVGIHLSMREVNNTPHQLQDLSSSSVPYDIVLAQDIIDDPSVMDGRVVAVMSGFYKIDAKRKAMISELKKRGVRLVFLADSGALGGAEATEGSVRIAEPRGLRPEMLNALVREAGGYVPVAGGLQVDMNGNFISIHCLKQGRYDFALPFAADAENMKTGERLKAVRSIPMDLTAGETRWYAIKEMTR